MTRVKICGISDLELACAALDAGADMLGFVFFRPSHRNMRPDSVRRIVREARAEFGHEWQAVGLDFATLLSTASCSRLDMGASVRVRDSGVGKAKSEAPRREPRSLLQLVSRRQLRADERSRPAGPSGPG